MYTAYFLVEAFFITTAAIALEIPLALFLHLRYKERVAQKRVGITLALFMDHKRSCSICFSGTSKS